MLIRTAAVTLFGSLAITGALAKNRPVSIEDQQQAACYDDAKRLCGEFLPDIEKTTSCMKPLRSQVSAECAAFYK